MLSLDTYTLYSALHESFTVDADQGEDYVDMVVILEGEVIYTTRLYGDSNRICTFYL